jgi:hypothetical protein
MSSRLFLRVTVTAVAAVVLAVSCTSNGPKPPPTEGTGDAGFPTTAPSTSAPTVVPPVTETPPTEPPTTGGNGNGDGDGGGNGIFLTEGGTYQITSDRMIYVAKQKYLVVSPKVWFGSTPTPKFPKGAYLATDTGAFLSKGGTWTNASSRDLKDHLRPVDPAAVLAKIRRLPISTWHYRAEAAGVRHLGPMAEDFRRAFGLGEDGRHIATVDEEGVALAALQALAKRSAKQDRTIAALKSELDRLATRVHQLQHG